MGSEYRDRPERRNSEAQARADLGAHNDDPYAHGRMIGRIMQENLTLRERFENRLSALERFRAQATVIGGVSLMLLGAVAAAVAQRIFAGH